MNEDGRIRAIILVENMIEYNRTMKKIIEQSDSITVEAVNSVLDFSINNLQYLIRLIDYEYKYVTYEREVNQ